MTPACPSDPFIPPLPPSFKAGVPRGRGSAVSQVRVSSADQQSQFSPGYGSQHRPALGTPAAVSRWTPGPPVRNKHKRSENSLGSCRQVLQHSSCPEQSPKNTVVGIQRACWGHCLDPTGCAGDNTAGRGHGHTRERATSSGGLRSALGTALTELSPSIPSILPLQSP